jgi:exopolysaccharide production protein ExoY
VDYTRSRPGLSGRWQISGRSDITYRERVQLDVHYVRNWSVPSDLGILAKTVPAVLTRRGSY